jgi:N-acetylmuramoyl-L-alanine amidase
MVHTAGRTDMGVLQANLAVLRLTYMPSVLLEVGYISTPSEEQFLMSISGRQSMAKSIYNAFKAYKK